MKLKKTPLKAIRENCFVCSGKSYQEISLCTNEKCILYSWRFGKNPEEERTNKKATALPTIREHCLNCCFGSTKEVRKCPIDDCPLYLWRLGKHPFIKRVETD